MDVSIQTYVNKKQNMKTMVLNAGRVSKRHSVQAESASHKWRLPFKDKVGKTEVLIVHNPHVCA